MGRAKVALPINLSLHGPFGGIYLELTMRGLHNLPLKRLPELLFAWFILTSNHMVLVVMSFQGLMRRRSWQVRTLINQFFWSVSKLDYWISSDLWISLRKIHVSGTSKVVNVKVDLIWSPLASEVYSGVYCCYNQNWLNYCDL